MLNSGNSSGSSGRVKGAEKHEIYAAALRSHPFYDFFTRPDLLLGRYTKERKLTPPPPPLIGNPQSAPNKIDSGIAVEFLVGYT